MMIIILFWIGKVESEEVESNSPKAIQDEVQLIGPIEVELSQRGLSSVDHHESRLQTVREDLMSHDEGVLGHAEELMRKAILSNHPLDRLFAAEVLAPMPGAATSEG